MPKTWASIDHPKVAFSIKMRVGFAAPTACETSVISSSFMPRPRDGPACFASST